MPAELTNYLSKTNWSNKEMANAQTFNSCAFFKHSWQTSFWSTRGPKTTFKKFTTRQTNAMLRNKTSINDNTSLENRHFCIKRKMSRNDTPSFNSGHFNVTSRSETLRTSNVFTALQSRRCPENRARKRPKVFGG